MHRHPAIGRRVGATLLCAVVAFGMSAAVSSPAWAKSKPKPKHHKTAKKKTGKTGSSKGSTKAQISSLATQVKKEKNATFSATFTVKGTGTSTETITIAQQPPKSLFKTGTGEVINTGTKTLYCNTSTTGTTSGTTCLNAGTTDPLGSMLSLFSPTTALSFFSQAETEAAAKIAGVTISFGSGTYAGLSSKCVTVSSGGQSAKYCVATNGILDYWSAGGSSVTLTQFSTSVPSGSFTPPAGATITTIG